MLTHSELAALARALSSERVLSVYLDPSVRNPASRQAWRVHLDNWLKEQRASLTNSPNEEREQFERCVALLDERLQDIADRDGLGGWVAFITSGGVRHSERLPVPTPTLANWSTGIAVAPYVCALGEIRPVVVVLADARKAAIYSYLDGKLEHVETIRAHRRLHRSHTWEIRRDRGFIQECAARLDAITHSACWRTEPSACSSPPPTAHCGWPPRTAG
jgi:hypothetical protein